MDGCICPTSRRRFGKVPKWVRPSTIACAVTVNYTPYPVSNTNQGVPLAYKYSGIGSPRSTAWNIAFTVGRCNTRMVKMPRTVPMGM